MVLPVFTFVGFVLLKRPKVGVDMENMIKRIVEMDEKARELTQDAQRAKVDSAADSAIKKQQMRDEYLDRARKRIKVNEKTEQEAADAEWKKTEQKYKDLAQQMNETYNTHHEEWVNQIVSHVIGG